MKPTPNFDRLARVYRWLEMITFGRSLWRCRCTLLDEMRSCRRALVIGDGDGRFTARLLETNRTVQIDAVDASPAMLSTLIRNCSANARRVQIHHADARTWTPANPPYDLVVTHFFLDCLTTDEVKDLAIRMRRYLTASTRWVVSEFAVPDSWFGWCVGRPLVTSLYLAFSILTGTRVFHLPDHRRALNHAGFALNVSQCSFATLLVSEMWTTKG
jgi:ubiquinone/menaquinone biosynthesis C-methylase UbiE